MVIFPSLQRSGILIRSNQQGVINWFITGTRRRKLTFNAVKLSRIGNVRSKVLIYYTESNRAAFQMNFLQS